MDSTQKPQVLLLGNGLLQAYGGISWEQLLQQIANRDDLPKKKDWYGEHLDLESPMPLRAIIVTKDHVDEAMKNVENQSFFYGREPSRELREALCRLLSMGFDHILTTNYSYELEEAALPQIICRQNNTVNKAKTDRKLREFQRHTTEVSQAEPKFLLHTYYAVPYHGRENKIWHIHGEARKPNSMMLGHYYYGSLLRRCQDLLSKRRNLYAENQKAGVEIPVKSWLDAFILGDVYCLGFGFGLSEMDLWWLLNRKKREKATNKGKLYFYDPAESSPSKFNEKYELLSLLEAEVRSCGITKTDPLTPSFYPSFYQAAMDDMETCLAKK